MQLHLTNQVFSFSIRGKTITIFNAIHDIPRKLRLNIVFNIFLANLILIITTWHDNVFKMFPGQQKINLLESHTSAEHERGGGKKNLAWILAEVSQSKQLAGVNIIVSRRVSPNHSNALFGGRTREMRLAKPLWRRVQCNEHIVYTVTHTLFSLQQWTFRKNE